MLSNYVAGGGGGGGNGVLFRWPYIVFAEQWLNVKGYKYAISY